MVSLLGDIPEMKVPVDWGWVILNRGHRPLQENYHEASDIYHIGNAVDRDVVFVRGADSRSANCHTNNGFGPAGGKGRGHAVDQRAA